VLDVTLGGSTVQLRIQHQDILYDYKVELTGVGNRSQINTDDNSL